MRVRAAILDGAMLRTEGLERAIGERDVLVAAPDERGERVLGVLVLDGEEITAVAVRRRRRGQGIGTGLVEAASERRERLVAEFDGEVRPFWAAVGFEIEPVEEAGRFRGVVAPTA